MKKILLVVAVGASFFACQHKGKQTSNASDAKDSIDTTIVKNDSTHYAGEIPAADGPGIRYDIVLSNDSTNGFALTETDLAAEKGKNIVNRYTGKAQLIEKDVNGAKKQAYKFTLTKGNAIYLLKVDSTTLRLVNEDLEESVNKGLNYDLKVVK